jgi:phospholipid/cholesterol/gamma-HCH transport system ATP-binding protein
MKRELRTEIGMFFQGSALFDSMTVEENVAFPLKMFTNDNKAVIKERVDFVLERVALTDASHKLPLKFLRNATCGSLALLSTGLNTCFVMNQIRLRPTAILIDNLIKEITEEYDITSN